MVEEGTVKPEPVAPAVTTKAHQLLVARVDALEKKVASDALRIAALEEFAEIAKGMISRLRPHSTQGEKSKLDGWNPFA